MRALRLALFGTLLTMTACTECGISEPDFCPGCSGDADTDTDGDTDTDTDADTDADTDTDKPFDGFDDPGDLGEVEADSEEDYITLDLTDVSGDSNREQDFYAIIINAAESQSGFKFWYSIDEDGSSRPALPGATAETHGAPSAYHANLRRWQAERAAAGEQAPPPPPPPDLEVGYDTDQFQVRSDLSNASEYEVTTATLAALGETVAIWVDNTVPIDWDYDCDGVIDLEDPDGAYGFDNCDLETIAGIVDSNIMINLEDLLGDFSDVNNDERVTVLVTPVLNRLPKTSQNPNDHAAVFESYADPEVDLSEYDPDENPISDYQEVIYVFAPDPYGYFNEDFTTTVEAYTAMSMAAQIAAETTHLILYNQKVLEQAAEDEETWLMQGLGAVAADICGFGAIFYDDAWAYLDAPHLYGLTSTTQSEDGGLSLEGRGAQYLFLRWLVDVYGDEILAELAQSSLTGVDNITSAVGTFEDEALEIDEIVLRWQVAMLTARVETVDGDALMDSDEWPTYGEAEFLTAPTEPPESTTPGTYYGANGYQRGVNFGGPNYYMENGTTADPTENAALRVTLGNTDHATYVHGYEFYGSMQGGYTASIVRVTEIPYDETSLNIQFGVDSMTGAVIRWNDPLFDDIAVEQSYSSSTTNAIQLPSIPDDGTPIYGVGRIGDSWEIATYDADGILTDSEFYDTDRWHIDLTDRAMGSSVRLHIWLDRHYENAGGDIAPYDPWLAVAPTAWVPTPNETETVRDRCTHADGIDFEYPTSVLQYLYYQEILSYDPIAEQTAESEETSGEDGDEEEDKDGFDACGSAPTETGIELSCENDWDSDGVMDGDEPAPETFYEQVLVKMCSLDADLLDQEIWDEGWFDRDTIDEDENASADMIENTGGSADDSGEEAWLEIVLEGGESYLLVVSGGTDSGDYEFTVREIPG